MEEMDPGEGTSSLFNSVLGGFTEEEYAEYKKMRKLEGDYIIDYDSDSSAAIDSRPSSPYGCDEVVTRFEVIPDEESEVVVDGSDEEFEKDEIVNMAKNSKTISWDSDAAMKYVNGEISFFELADIMENSKPKKPRKRTADGHIKENVDVETVDGEAKPQKIKRTRRKMCDLPKEFSNLMGVANMSFANGNVEECQKICFDLIKQAPFAQQPYQTLAMAYEKMGDMKHALQCFLLASYLNPSDTEEWIRLAGLSIEQSQIQQAIRCYSFAIRNEPGNINFLWERCNLYEQLGDRKNALAGYEQILKALDRPEDGVKCVDISREMAKVHHENEDLVNAIKVLENAFSKFPALITSEDVNFLLELQLTLKAYKAALKNFVQHCGVALFVNEMEISSHEQVSGFNEEQLKSITSCTVPDVLPVDLKVKLLLCLIHLQCLEATKDLMKALLEESPEDMGDLYLDVSEAFMEIKEYASALPLLSDLVKSKKYSLAAVWLKYGDCLNMLSQGKEASEVYETVLKMAPSYQEARISLSKILVSSGKKEEAAKALRQEYEEGKEDAEVNLNVLVERCDHLYDLKEYEEFIKAATLAQYSHCFPLATPFEFALIFNNQSYKRRFEAIRDYSRLTRTRPCFVNTSVPADKLWDIFQKLCHKLYEFKRFEELQNICLESMCSSIWRKDKTRARTVDLYALLGCLYNNNQKYAYNLIKDAIVKNLDSNRAWNLLCLNVTLSQQIWHNRFCLRLLIKNPDHLALALFNAHCAMNSGSYKHALGVYMSCLKKYPENPILSFFCGITYIHMSCQKFATKRFYLMAQAIPFLQRYMDLRNQSQEALYNIGRALHQLGIKDAAVTYYKKALEAQPALSTPSEMETFDLKHEIVYNLAQIYMSSGSSDLASIYLRTYNVV